MKKEILDAILSINSKVKKKAKTAKIYDGRPEDSPRYDQSREDWEWQWECWHKEKNHRYSVSIPREKDTGSDYFHGAEQLLVWLYQNKLVSKSEVQNFVKKYPEARDGIKHDEIIAKKGKTKEIENLIKKILELQKKKQEYFDEHLPQKQKAEFIGCKHCQSKVNKKYILKGYYSCPVCEKDLRADYIIEKLCDYNNKIKELAYKIYKYCNEGYNIDTTPIHQIAQWLATEDSPNYGNVNVAWVGYDTKLLKDSPEVYPFLKGKEKVYNIFK